MIFIPVLFAAAPVDAQVTYSGQGLVYSTRGGGDGVAVDHEGYVYVLQRDTCVPNGGDMPTEGAAVIKLDRDVRNVIYRTLVSCGASAHSIAVDAQGNAYVAGTTRADWFDATLDLSRGATTTVVFAVKLDSAGEPVYAVKIGGMNNSGAAIAVDHAGSAYVTGAALSDDFPVTPGAYQPTHRGGPNNWADAFVFKLDPAGTRLVYSTYLGGTNDEEALAIAVDGDGQAYVAGDSLSSDFPITSGAIAQVGSVPFVTKLSADGSALVYSARVGGSITSVSGLAIDGSRNVYLAGYTSGDEIPTTPGASLRHNAGQSDAWLVKLNITASHVVYGTYLGGTGSDYGRSVAVGPDGTAYVAGLTDEGGGFPVTLRAVQAVPQGGGDAFVTAVDDSGAISYSTRLGGTLEESLPRIAVDVMGDVYATGYSFSLGEAFPVTPGTVETAPSAVHFRAFLSKLVPRASVIGTARSSSVEEESLGPLNTIDGNPHTRWSSAFRDGEKLYIDLGQRILIDRIMVTWETAYADSYEIRVTDSVVPGDDLAWTTVYSTTMGDGGVDEVAGLSITGRYVWIVGRHRATPWGVSVWEMAVYGTPTDSGNLPPTVTITAPVEGASFVGPIDLDVTVDASDPDGTVARVVFAVDGVDVATDDAAPFAALVTIVAGYHAITAVAFDDDGVRSSNAWVHVTVETGQTGGNLALGRPAVASSVEAGGLGPENAVDGAAATRWSSAFSDPQWIYVDLGARFFINTVALDWEAAAAADFDVQVSDDAFQWKTIRSAIGSPGSQVLSGLMAVGRYVRIYGRARATEWGYSLHELGVYGTPFSGMRNVAAGKTTVASSIEAGELGPEYATDAITNTRWGSAFADNQWIYVDLEHVYDIERIVLRWEAAFAAEYLVQVSNDTTMWRTIRAVETGGGTDDLRFDRESARFVRIYALQRATEWGISLWELEVYGRQTSLAQNMAPTSQVQASSVEGPGLEPSRAIDGDANTRWSSDFADGQWIALDLGASLRVRQVVLRWEEAFASAYSVQVSSDGVNWETVFDTATGDGGVDNLSVAWSLGRYLRIVCIDRATEWGFSLWDIEVYGN